MSFLRLEIEAHATPSARKIARAADVLHKGGVGAYPTDTVYALGCTVDARRAVERIYRARKVDDKHRLAMLCPDMSSAATYANFSQRAYKLARRIFPGPYTLILPASREVPRHLWDTKRRRVIGIRIPSHPVTLALLKQLGRALVTTSAVPGGQDEACTDADELVEAFAGQLDLVVDSGSIHGEPSTVISMLNDTLEVVREGAGSLDDLVD